jgi:phage tail sheath protein FI
MDHPSSAAESGKAPWAATTAVANNSFSTTKAYTTTLTPTEIRSTLSAGVGTNPSEAEIATAMQLFANDELVDVNLIFCGSLPVVNASDVIDNVADIRKDCVVFLSPDKDSVVGQTSGQKDNILADITSAGLTRSSYGVMDSGWKYMYDRYYDRYVWVPCNGDTAGLCARTDADSDPWFSPAGYNRGRIKNAVKLAYSPNKADRDALYKGGVNPIVGFPGSGIVLFGDKTLLEKPSAFDRINVRRLFIVLEKAIATASKFQLFEFNDEFSRAQFKNLVEPFLRDVQGRRGIYNFRVVCDGSNNTQQVIDSNSFVADIFIQPARSINFITLNFVATRTGIQFEEVGA